jgi:glycosyltransferase involved in cell wall biosynthesis
MYKKKIKIGFAIWTLKGMGGSEKLVYEVSSKLDRNKFEPCIISFEEGSVREIYQKSGIEVYSIEKKKWFDFKFLTEIRKILKIKRIEIINAHHYYPFLYLTISAIGLKTKIIYTEHAKWTIEEFSTLRKLLIKILLLKASAVIAISKQIFNYWKLCFKINSSKIIYLPNGIDIDRYSGYSNKNIRNRLGIFENQKVIGIIANLRPEKNHKILISAFRDIEADSNNFILMIVGLDCMGGELQKFCKKSGNENTIKFLGKRDDIPEILGSIDIFCLPSVHEGLPLILLEAMAANVPIVASDVVGNNEVIIDNFNGLLFKPNDKDDLKNKIIMVLEDDYLKSKIRKNAKLFIEKNYSIKEMLKNYEKLFVKLAN